VNVSFALVSCAWLVGASASRVPICVYFTSYTAMYVGKTRHVDMLLRFEYAVWYLQGMEEELCI
jgi:hypothetical protein